MDACADGAEIGYGEVYCLITQHFFFSFSPSLVLSFLSLFLPSFLVFSLIWAF